MDDGFAFPASALVLGLAGVARTMGFVAHAPASRQRVEPVSYTHLDVYKRQAEINAMSLPTGDGLKPTLAELVALRTVAQLSLIHI